MNSSQFEMIRILHRLGHDIEIYDVLAFPASLAFGESTQANRRRIARIKNLFPSDHNAILRLSPQKVISVSLKSRVILFIRLN